MTSSVRQNCPYTGASDCRMYNSTCHANALNLNHTCANLLHRTSSHPLSGGHSGTKTQSASDARAATKARYLTAQITLAYNTYMHHRTPDTNCQQILSLFLCHTQWKGVKSKSNLTKIGITCLLLYMQLTDYTLSQRTPMILFVHNFVKHWPIFNILCPLDSAKKLQ